MAKYTILECLDCGTRVRYPTRTADGKRCKNCNSGLLLPVKEVVEYRKKYPRVKKLDFNFEPLDSALGCTKHKN